MHRIIIYIFGIFQAAFYTPVIISFAFFFVLILMSLPLGFTSQLLRYFPNGQYNAGDVISMYWKYAFIVSLVISLVEILLKKQLVISLKKKLLWLSIILFVGYSFVFIFLISKTHFTAVNSLLIVIPSLIIAFLASLASSLMSAFINFLDKFFANQGYKNTL